MSCNRLNCVCLLVLRVVVLLRLICGSSRCRQIAHPPEKCNPGNRKDTENMNHTNTITYT